METNARLTRKEVLEAVKRVRNRLASPDHWCKNKLALTPTGGSCLPTDGLACKWCLYGAMMAELDIPTRHEVSDIVIETLRRKTRTDRGYSEFNFIEQFNDAPETTHAKILELLDDVIRELS